MKRIVSLLFVFTLILSSGFANDEEIITSSDSDCFTTEDSIIVDNIDFSDEEIAIFDDEDILVDSMDMIGEEIAEEAAAPANADDDANIPLADSSYFKKDAKIGFSSHVYVDTAMLYGYPTLGASWDMGIQIDTITISAYLRYGHFFRPLGSNTGKLAIAEEFGEAGLSMKIKIYELARFYVSLGINTGWYQQWLMLNSNANTYNLVHNGMMVRPEVSIGWRALGWWRVELGIFYQTPMYPPYDEYQGWGCFLKIV